MIDIDFGLSDYNAVYAEQKRWLAKRIEDACQDVLMLGEHPAVITLGRSRTAADNVLVSGPIPIVETERGGDVTYHGPGQLIAYPIMKLAPGQRDLHRFVRALEEAIIQTLSVAEISGFRQAGATGVWVEGADGQVLKIASIGIAVKQWVTYHGLALNVTNDLEPYQHINPCGFPAEVMTSMEALKAQALSLTDVKTILKSTLFQQLAAFT